MNRPLWLDFVYVGAFFVPPVMIAVVMTAALSRYFGWPNWAWLLAYLASAAISILLWLGGLIAWSRYRSGATNAARSDHE